MAGPAPRDFPYIRATPEGLSTGRWAMVLGSCVAGFAALMLLARAHGGPMALVGPVLFVVMPLLALRAAAGRGWTALFPRPTLADVLAGLLAVPLALLLSGAVALVFTTAGTVAVNPVAGLLVRLDGWERVLFIAGTAPQLLGEELITILPFLALLALFHRRFGLALRPSVVAAWILSAAVFGLLHLSTYCWNLAQVLLVIAVSRLALTIPYLLTRSVWSSFIAHITLDWSIFALVLLGAARG
ncbi:CPBP family intramembrane glutamic endopeptidase [Caulobacter hibisci]|uniref:CPBP family intramembrane metalloprotease n=1 Tax=Caulobacter hibisci TaxID=2035993 RepID=A0ABS0T308_9CAUL|nr:CPBP family intramembrane glutamic endopeptidase [Caulobacter hibisci]MBI1686214.1 CPBP family intramembrane metalloprotease [Caulobacter hibisci]